MPEGHPVEDEVLTCCDLASLQVAHGHLDAAMSIYQSHRLGIFLELVIGCVYTDAVNPCQVKLHRCIVIIAGEPSIEEAPVDLLDLNYHHILDVFMYDEFC